MTRVKVISAEICNWQGRFRESVLENKINTFLAENPEITVLDIKMQNVDVHYHNNGEDNTIQLWCIITYTL